MVSAWSSHDQDDSNQETPYRPVRCLINTRHCAFYKAMHQSRGAACQLPGLPVLPCCLALGLWLGPPPRASCPWGQSNRGPRWALSVLRSTSQGSARWGTSQGFLNSGDGICMGSCNEDLIKACLMYLGSSKGTCT